VESVADGGGGIRQAKWVSDGGWRMAAKEEEGMKEVFFLFG